MKDFENKFFGVLFFALWIVVLYHLVTNQTGATAIARTGFNGINSFFGTLFTGTAQQVNT